MTHTLSFPCAKGVIYREATRTEDEELRGFGDQPNLNQKDARRALLVVPANRRRTFIELVTAPFSSSTYEIARAIPKAAAAASPPTSVVWSALRKGLLPVKRPLM